MSAFQGFPQVPIHLSVGTVECWTAIAVTREQDGILLCNPHTRRNAIYPYCQTHGVAWENGGCPLCKEE